MFNSYYSKIASKQQYKIFANDKNINKYDSYNVFIILSLDTLSLNGRNFSSQDHVVALLVLPLEVKIACDEGIDIGVFLNLHNANKQRNKQK